MMRWGKLPFFENLTNVKSERIFLKGGFILLELWNLHFEKAKISSSESFASNGMT